MLAVSAEASRGPRWSCLLLTAVVALLASASDSADARYQRKQHYVRSHGSSSSYNPPYADIVMDARTGAVLHQSSPDGERHPASLTKIMTLYLLFERLEAGKIRLDTEMPVSERASAQAPTKLGLKPGSTLAVEDAIKGLVTRSANDAAVVIAEMLGGSEDEFARTMTRKARALGMRNTTYRNASGLPDDEQVTTARDQALLGIAIQQRFPKYYRYFSTTSFAFRGQAIRNHNHLLGQVEGIDGIKTGFTLASGFNLVSSVRRGPRHLVAVVLGGRSAGQRDARMRELIASNIARASPKDTQFAIAASPEPQAPPEKPQFAAVATAPRSIAAPAVSESTSAIPHPGSTAPIKPVQVKTVSVKFMPPKTPVAANALPAPTQSEPFEPVRVATAAPEPAPQQETAVPAPAAEKLIEPPTPQKAVVTPVPEKPVVMPPPAEKAAKEKKTVLASAMAKARDAIVPAAKADEAPRAARHGWVIQVGAYEDESEAKQRLSSAQSKAAPLLGKAAAYTEKTKKGEKTYFRARFAGFDQPAAEAACRKLKRSDIDCMALKI